ncbi:MAG: oligosaccharide flippase family protein, partial [Candidatus Odinarchaeota archaeon]
MSLANSAVAGVRWSAISQAILQILTLITVFILAHLLVPSDFGLVEIANVFIGFITLFRDLGMSAAIIQKKDISNELLASTFWVNVAFGVVTMIIVLLFSPIIAVFFEEILITQVLAILSITFPISSLGILQESLLKRDLEFKKIAVINLSATLAGSIIGIGSALLGAG